MIQTPIQRCDCCGWPVNTQSGDNCPRCDYPINASKEKNFLIAAIDHLQRVITYGGANMTVAGLMQRYQARLNHLRQLDAAVATAGTPLATTKRVAPAEQFIISPQEAIDVKLPGTATEQAATVPVGARVEESGGGRHPGDGVQALYGRPLVPPDGGRPGTEQAIVTPSPETRRAPQRVFSWRSFFDEQGITILASIGAILILVGSLSFIVTTTNILLAFLVVFIVHALFGIGSAIAYRFASLRLVARIYSGIFALLVPLVGFAGYNLAQGNLVHLSTPILIALAAVYAAIVYSVLAVSQRFALFGYLGMMSLVIADLAIARDLNLDYWWWPGMLMLLALPALLSLLRPAGNAALPRDWPLAGPLAVLREPIRVFMLLIVAASATGVVLTSLYSLTLDIFQAPVSGIRFSILSIALLLFLWTALYLWLTRRGRWVLGLAYLLLACVLAFCYAFDYQAAGYALALTGVAVFYHAFNRFASRLLQGFGTLGLRLDQLALALVAVVPVISSPLLPQQLLLKADLLSLTAASPWHFGGGWETIAEFIVIAIGLALTMSIMLRRANAQETTATRRNAWPWLLLLAGALLTWELGLVVLALDAVPLWSFLGLTLAMVATAVVVRQRFGSAWADPLDVLALGEAIVTLTLIRNLDTMWALLLFFAALSYAVLLYQCRRHWLFLPVVFALAALLILAFIPRQQVILLVALLLPLAAVAVHRFMPELLLSSGPAGTGQPRITAGWEWPLLVIGLLSGAATCLFDVLSSGSAVHSWLGITFPVALELGIVALAWYMSAALARVKWWLIAAVGFAVVALLTDTSFWSLAVLAPVAAVLAFAISRSAGREAFHASGGNSVPVGASVARSGGEGLHGRPLVSPNGGRPGRDWALPLYSVALLAAVMMGVRGFEQQQLFASAWALLGFAALIYIIGVVEDMTLFLWVAPLFATWSVFDSAVLGDLYRPPVVALLCAALGVAVGRLHSYLPPLLRTRYNSVLKYALPFYATTVAAAVLTGVYGTLGGVNHPFYGAIPDAMLVYAVVAFSVVLFENRPGWSWLAAGFAVWGVLLATQTTAYYVVGIGIAMALVGLLVGRFVKPPLVNTEASPSWAVPARFTWSWPWYGTALVAALLLGSWSSLPLEQPGVGFIELSLLAFTVLALLIMLVERTPELLVFPVGLAAWAVGLSHGEVWQLMVAYSLLCVLTFASQFTWQVISPAATNWLPATWLHRVLALGGQACVVLAIIAQGGLSADAWPLVHVGAGALIILSLLLFWHGRLQNTHAYRRYSYYGAGLLLSLVLPWELIAFRQTSLDLLALGPASYLALIAPLLMRDESLPEHHRTGQSAAVVGAALLLLPTLWLSFNDNNLLPTLILAGEAMALLLLGIGTRLRIFVLSGAGLVIVAILHSLFLQAFALPLSLTLLGLILIAIATGLSIARHRLQLAWSRWE